MTVTNITADQARARQQAGATIVDVRSDGEWAQGHAAGAIHHPVETLDVSRLPADAELIFICASGGRSLQAARLAAGTGRDVFNVVGGTVGWQAMGLPMA